MITVIFRNNELYRTVSSLWQYDYGQILRIQGLNLPPAVEIHFSLQEMGGEAVTRIGVTANGVTDVVIPDSMLENAGYAIDYYIYAYIYLTNEDSGETTHAIKMRVKSRPKPEVFKTPGDAEIFREAIIAVNQSAEAAAYAAIESEAWAHGHNNYPESLEDNAKYYADQAELSAGRAEQTAALNGFMQFYIEEGHLIETKTNNMDLEIRLEEGRLIIRESN